jgi:hypothetical protein
VIVAFTASWETTEASQAMVRCFDAGIARWQFKDPTLTEDIIAGRLGVVKSRISAMRTGTDPGPAFLRFASLPLDFWIGFLKEWGSQFDVLVITGRELKSQIRWLNKWMVRTMKRDVIRSYTPEQIAAADATLEKRSA